MARLHGINIRPIWYHCKQTNTSLVLKKPAPHKRKFPFRGPIISLLFQFRGSLLPPPPSLPSSSFRRQVGLTHRHSWGEGREGGRRDSPKSFDISVIYYLEIQTRFSKILETVKFENTCLKCWIPYSENRLSSFAAAADDFDVSPSFVAGGKFGKETRKKSK